MNPTYTGSIDSLRDFWENRSASFEKDYGIRQKGIMELARVTSELTEGKLVLDIGCGPGIIASLYPKNTHVIGLDFSSLMLKQAAKRIQELVLGDSLTLPFRNETFEVATCFFVASDYVAKEMILSEAFRVIQTGGTFLYADYSPLDEHWKLRREIRAKLGESCGIRIEGEKKLSEKLKHVGLSVHEVEFIRFTVEFRLERYVKSRDEIRRLKEISPNLWKRLGILDEEGKVHREFVLLISRK